MEKLEDDMTYLSKEQKLKQQRKSCIYYRKHDNGKSKGYVVQNCSSLKEGQEKINVEKKVKANEVANVTKEEEPVICEAVRNFALVSITPCPSHSYWWIVYTGCTTLMTNNSDCLLNIKHRYSTVTVGDEIIIQSYEYCKCSINAKIPDRIVQVLHLLQDLYVSGLVDNLFS